MCGEGREGVRLLWLGCVECRSLAYIYFKRGVEANPPVGSGHVQTRCSAVGDGATCPHSTWFTISIPTTHVEDIQARARSATRATASTALRPNAPLSLTRCDDGFSGRDCSLSLQDARARVQMQEMIVDHLDRMIAPSVCRFVTDLHDRWLVELFQCCRVHSSHVGFVYVVAY